MSQANVITEEIRNVPIERVLVFNDRAEVKRVLKTKLAPGTNEVNLKNVSQSFVYDSVRVDGRGNASIHEVLVKDRHALKEETDSPKIAALREEVALKLKVLNKARDRSAILSRRSEVLDKVVADVGSGVLPKESSVIVDDNVLASLTKMIEFYEESSAKVRDEQRENQILVEKAEAEYNKLFNQLSNEEATIQMNSYTKIFTIVLESKEGGDAELDIIYQVYGCNWTPSYDIRVDTDGDKHLKISYYAQVMQNTGEDWTEVPLVLSTAQPCLGGNIPELGTLEASFFRPPPPAPVPCPTARGGYGAMNMMKRNVCAMEERSAMSYDSAPMMAEMCAVAGGAVVEQATSTQFSITRPVVIPSSSDTHKVTIDIIDLKPQLVHECVPSKNLSVFLTASAINTSQLPILRGEASVYLNNSFVAKTAMKNVSPGERFSASLGVDTAVRAEYKPAKKYHEQVGIINKSSSTVTEQVIILKNTKTDPVLIIVKEHIPRSTDDKIKIRVVNPANVAPHEDAVSVHDAPPTPREGAKMTAQHNLEWTVKLTGGQIFEMNLKWALEHPKEEKIEFHEKY